MTVLGYRHTGIICRDIKKSLYFYKDLLGLKIVQEFWDDTDYINKVSGLKKAKVHFIKLKMKSGEILELLSSNANERKQLDLLPRCWHVKDYFSIKYKDGNVELCFL